MNKKIIVSTHITEIIFKNKILSNTYYLIKHKKYKSFLNRIFNKNPIIEDRIVSMDDFYKTKIKIDTFIKQEGHNYEVDLKSNLIYLKPSITIKLDNGEIITSREANGFNNIKELYEEIENKLLNKETFLIYFLI